MRRTIFTSIRSLYTLAGVVEKEGRRTLAADLSVIENAAMVVSAKGAVEWVGAQRELPKIPGAARVSLKGRSVLPAFVECHTHLLYAGTRASEFERRNSGESYLAIAQSGGGIQSTVRATAAASSRALQEGVLERLAALAAQGVATVEIKTGYAASIDEERRHLQLLLALRRKLQRAGRGPRLVITCLAAHSLPPGEREESWLAQIRTKLFPLLKKEAIRVDIFIDKGAFSKTGGAEFLRAAKAAGLAFCVHADQLSASGATDLGCELGAQSADHVIEIGEAQATKLAKSKTVAVLLPAADLYTRLPYPKARLLINCGAQVALATDHNPGSSPGLDLALVGLLARAGMQMTLPEVIAAYTYNAAAALGRQATQGALVPGHRADFVVLKPGADLADLFYAVGPGRTHAAIQSVWRDGHMIV